MIKSELITRMAAKLVHLSEKDVAAGVNELLQLMSNTLYKRDRIEIRGFGSFSVRYRAPRNAHNPKTGEKVITEEKYSPYFRAGKEMRIRIDNSRQSTAIKEDHGEDDNE